MLRDLKKLTLIAVLLGVASGIAACDDTLSGLGQDTEDVGDEIDENT